MLARIGITTSLEAEEQRLHHAYVRAVEAAGGLPVIVPMLRTDEAMRAVAENLDGLVITGGPAVTDGLIGTLPEDLAEPDDRRTRSDRALLDAFLEAGRPMLGICYGMQLVNAHLGGTLYADVERQREDTLTHSDKRGGTEHALHIEPSTQLHRILEQRTMTVNTRHIQAIAEVGIGLRVAATAPDGVIEAIESEDGTILGVQFHPERMGPAMLPLFHHLVQQAARRRTPPLTAALTL